VEDDVKGLAEAMLICFDFAPATFTDARTVQHGGALAARHVITIEPGQPQAPHLPVRDNSDSQPTIRQKIKYIKRSAGPSRMPDPSHHFDHLL
jgi:hypothetical protein